jgi:Ca-activated chloride channel family protein
MTMKRSRTLQFFILMYILLIQPAALMADGFIVIPDPHDMPAVRGNPFPLAVKYHHVEVTIKDRIATTSIDQVFFNPTAYQLEGEYIFPIPAGAVIEEFGMVINGKAAEAELLDAGKARAIYEEIVRQMKDPALFEYIGQDIFKLRIFPIEPRSEKRVMISYTEVCGKESGTIEYVYPLNTEKFSAAPLEEVSVNVTVESSWPIKNIYCTTHEAEIVHKQQNRAVVSWEERGVKPDRDFTLYYRPDESDLGFSLLTYKAGNQDGFFFLDIAPGYIMEGDATQEKDISFVLDVSGSMAGDKLTQAKKALLFCLNNLNGGDRFNIIRFSTEADALFGEPASADEANLKKAADYVTELKAIGGTNIEEAIHLALGKKEEKDRDSNRPHIVLFITDGKPTIGERDGEKLVKKIEAMNTNHIRLFTIGIGYDINIHLLDRLTTLTRAFRTYITPEEDIELKISDFYTKVQSPVLTDIRIDVKGNVRLIKVHPGLNSLPDLFRGSSLTLLGRYEGSGNAKIDVKGTVRGVTKEFAYQASFASHDTGQDFIAPLWAARRTGYLLDQVRLSGEEKELVEEITILARQYGIITPYTSYLILEDEWGRVDNNKLDSNFQTLGNMTSRSGGFYDQVEEEYEGMQKESGRGGVIASKEVQQLNSAKNKAQTGQGTSRMYVTDSKGNTANIAEQVKNVQGRAFYNAENVWVDSSLQSSAKGNTRRIRFGSNDYFTLIEEEPESAYFLALGKNVRFVLNKTMYEIYE